MRTVTLQSAGFDEAADNLFDEKRVAARTFENSTEQISGRIAPAVTKEGGEQFLSVGDAEGASRRIVWLMRLAPN